MSKVYTGASMSPVLIGDGTPFFGRLGTPPVALGGPYSVQEGTGVTHLRYRVPR